MRASIALDRQTLRKTRKGTSAVTKNTLVIVVIAAALFGCAKSSFPVLDAKLGDLKGQPSKQITDKFGPPDETQTTPRKTYIWTLGNYSGGAVGFRCTVKVFVDKDDNIVDYDFTGNVAGCGHYAGLLDDSYHVAHGVFD